jgi:hypothetical protein
MVCDTTRPKSSEDTFCRHAKLENLFVGGTIRLPLKRAYASNSFRQSYAFKETSVLFRYRSYLFIAESVTGTITWQERT